jgi:molybdopterin-guanine dinucleotide biosynthesis protein A
VTAFSDISGLVLAGGASRRFGGTSKAFALLGGKPLIVHALRPLLPLQHIAVSANQDHAAFAAYAPTILADEVTDQGPLAGILTGLDWAATLGPEIQWLVSVPVDVPFLPDDLVTRLSAMREDTQTVVAATASDTSPVCALWNVSQRLQMHDALARGVRKMSDYLSLVSWRRADLPQDRIDPLFNINDHRALVVAEGMLAQLA